ncbi:MAG: hypothetical protein Q9180_006772 [Flavoplaca navasiana]
MPPQSNDESKNALEALRKAEEDWAAFIRPDAVGFDEHIGAELGSSPNALGQRPARTLLHSSSIKPDNLRELLDKRIALLKARKAIQALQSQGPAESSKPEQQSVQGGYGHGQLEDAEALIDKYPAKASPMIATEAPADYRLGDKRAADDPPQRQPPARRPKGDLAQQPQAPIATAPIKEAFPNHELPPNGKAGWSFCTFGQLDKASKTPWLIGELVEQSVHGYALSAKFNPHPSGPSLSLRLHMELESSHLPFKRQHWHDYAEYQWTLQHHTGTRAIESFSYQLFTDWINDASPEILALPQVVEAMKPGNRERAVVVSCRLHEGLYTDFYFPHSWRKIPSPIADKFHRLASRPTLGFNSFLLVLDSRTVKERTIPYFRRLVNECS